MFLCFCLKIEGLKAVVLKLAAADKLRSQAFVRSDQGVPKTNKRGESKLHDKLVILTQAIICRMHIIYYIN